MFFNRKTQEEQYIAYFYNNVGVFYELAPLKIKYNVLKIKKLLQIRKIKPQSNIENMLTEL